MAKIIKKRRKLKIEAFATLFFFVAMFLYLGSMTILKSYNVLLSTQSEAVSAEVGKLSEEVSTLETTVKALASSDRIMKIAEENDIKPIQSNVKLMDDQ